MVYCIDVWSLTSDPLRHENEILSGNVCYVMTKIPAIHNLLTCIF